MAQKLGSPQSPLPLKILNLLLMTLDLAGHAVVGVFLTNRWLMGLPEIPSKAVTLVIHIAIWPLVGLFKLWRSGAADNYAVSLLRPASESWPWRVFFTFVGARWLAQEIYRRLNPPPHMEEVLSTQVHDFDMSDYVAEVERPGRGGLGRLVHRLNHFYRPQVVTHELRLNRLPPEFDGFTIVQISDLHYGPKMSTPYLQRLIELCIETQPDLIALSGDYQTFPQDIGGAAHTLAPIGEWSCRERAGMGAMAVLGNHDRAAGAPYVTAALRKVGIQVLNNQHMRLQRGSASLHIAGVADPWGHRADIDLALHGIPPGSCVILLAHVPDYFIESSKKDIDLQLSGHNHGGQVKLPVLGAIFVSSRYNRRYAEGFHKRNGALMYISRGVGGKPAIRWGARPEITKIVLRSTS